MENISNPPDAQTGFLNAVNTIVDQYIREALEQCEKPVIAISREDIQKRLAMMQYTAEELIIGLLAERKETAFVNDCSDPITIALTQEAIDQYRAQERKELAWEEVAVIHANHTLWLYGKGGEQADFTLCQLHDMALPHMVFDHAIFRNALLMHLDLTNSSFCDCDFTGARFIGCDMPSTTMSRCCFHGAVFDGCRMRGTQLNHGNFAGAFLRDCDVWSANMQDICVDKLALQNTNLDQADIRGLIDEEAAWKQMTEPLEEIEGM